MTEVFTEIFCFFCIFDVLYILYFTVNCEKIASVCICRTCW